MEHLPDCQPGESLKMTIAKDGETVATLRGKVSKAGKDGSYSITLEAAEADDDGPIEVKKSAKAKAAMESKPKKKSMSKGAQAALGY